MSDFNELTNAAINAQKLGDFASAANYWQQASAIEPENADVIARNIRCALLLQDIDAATKILDSAPASIQHDKHLQLERANIACAKQQWVVALELYKELASDFPQNVGVVSNRAQCLQMTGQFEEALQQYRSAAALAPSHHVVQYNLALLEMLMGNYDTGFAHYKNRWQLPAFSNKLPIHCNLRVASQSLTDEQTVRLVYEQGIGDTVLFARALEKNTVDNRSIQLIIQPRLRELFTRSFPHIQCVIDDGDVQNKQDCYGIGDWFGDCVPRLLAQGGAPYLRADDMLAANIRQQYGMQKPRVGIACASDNKVRGARKSLALEACKTWFRHSDITWVNLQYGPQRDTLHEFVLAQGGHIITDEHFDPLGDIDPYAAQIAALDLVISTPNAAVDIAAALGRPTWIATPSVPDWRWGVNHSHSLWYPDCTLFRQQDASTWDNVIQLIQTNLTAFVKNWNAHAKQ